jgi:hypothetical protein
MEAMKTRAWIARHPLDMVAFRQSNPQDIHRKWLRKFSSFPR